MSSEDLIATIRLIHGVAAVCMALGATRLCLDGDQHRADTAYTGSGAHIGIDSFEADAAMTTNRAVQVAELLQMDFQWPGGPADIEAALRAAREAGLDDIPEVTALITQRTGANTLHCYRLRATVDSGALKSLAAGTGIHAEILAKIADANLSVHHENASERTGRLALRCTIDFRVSTADRATDRATAQDTVARFLGEAADHANFVRDLARQSFAEAAGRYHVLVGNTAHGYDASGLDVIKRLDNITYRGTEYLLWFLRGGTVTISDLSDPDSWAWASPHENEPTRDGNNGRILRFPSLVSKGAAAIQPESPVIETGSKTP